MKIDLKELEALARAATPGPWEATRQTDEECNFIGYFIEAGNKTISDDGTAPGHADALFIAAANPAAVLELISLASALPAPPVTPKHIEEIKEILLWPVTEDEARVARDMLQSLHFDLSMAQDQAAQPKCFTCSGHGLIGGLMPGDGGYHSEDCPVCSGSGITDSRVTGNAQAALSDEPVAWMHQLPPGSFFGDTEHSPTRQVLLTETEAIMERESHGGTITPLGSILATRQSAPVASMPAVASPEGWQWVPLELTNEMLLAARGKGPSASKAEMWAAMLAVAPKPDAAPVAAAVQGDAEWKRQQLENRDFHEWWESSGQKADHDLRTENAARATWQERAQRAASVGANPVAVVQGSDTVIGRESRRLGWAKDAKPFDYEPGTKLYTVPPAQPDSGRDADFEKFRGHSIELNSTLWRMLEIMGEVSAQDEKHFGEPSKISARFFAKASAAMAAQQGEKGGA